MNVFRRTKYVVIGAICILIFVFSPLFQVAKSYAVMSVYSEYHKINSSIYKEDIRIYIPGGLRTLARDYYPFVMTYDTSVEFSDHRNEPIDLVILYNFGAMEWLKGASLLYDEESPYYSSFYGAYVARFKDSEKQYGMNADKSLNIEEIMDVTDFDLKHLVLESVGANSPVLEYEILNLTEESYINIDGDRYQVIDAKLEMSGMWHPYIKDYTAYLQYGSPVRYRSDSEAFKTIDGYGRIYIRFDEERRISYFFYSIAQSKETILKIENDFILKSNVKG